MLKAIAYTGGDNAPSGWHRVERYIAHLRRENVDLTLCPSRAGKYPPEKKWLRPAWALWNLAEHVPAVLRSYTYDITLLQREMLSTLVTLEPFAKRPRVLDVDDAIWVHRGGGFARRLAELSDHVICGNHFLSEEFSRWNPSVSVVPTPVDTRRLVPANRSKGRPVIGWLGLSSGFGYLYAIEPALREVLRNHPEARLRVVSSSPPKFQTLPVEQVEFVFFTRQQEAADIQAMMIGIMPLDDSVGSRGKCSFKMMQYMACGLPAVVSPVGMNAEVLRQGEVGFGARNLREWVDSLEILLKDPDLCARMGKTGRMVVQQNYSLEVLAPRLAKILFRVADQHRSQPLLLARKVTRTDKVNHAGELPP